MTDKILIYLLTFTILIEELPLWVEIGISFVAAINLICCICKGK